MNENKLSGTKIISGKLYLLEHENNNGIKKKLKSSWYRAQARQS